MNRSSPERRTLERYDGHKALWLRVIIRAAFDLASYKNDPRLNLRKHADSASKWIFDTSYLFNSFESICVLLGLPPERIRKWASSLTKEEVQKMEHLERGSTIRPDVDMDLMFDKLPSGQGNVEEF